MVELLLIDSSANNNESIRIACVNGHADVELIQVY
jgi:hypothetical protein